MMQSHTHCCEMMLLCLSLMLLCVSTNSDNIMMFRESGEDITVKCSCNYNSEVIVGMYLYHQTGEDKKEREVFFLGENGSPSKRPKYQNRTQIRGSFMNQTITITNLTADDSGIFSCIYKTVSIASVCRMTYTAFVKGVVPTAVCPTAEVSPFQVSTFSIPCVISMLATVIVTLLILLIYWRVKRCSRRRRRTRQVSNDYVYEVMTKNASFAPTL